MSTGGDEPTGGARISGIEMAIRFVAAQPAGAGKILTVHYRRPERPLCRLFGHAYQMAVPGRPDRQERTRA
jgi:hypothetical protein